jgi:hypothetical protein
MKSRIGSLLATLLGLALLVYSAVRSLDFISLTLPVGSQLLALFGLAALDGGIVAWLLSYLHGAKGSWQRAISLLMILVDFVGAVTMFTADTIYRSGTNGLTAGLSADQTWTAIIGLSVVIALNIGATVAFHITDPATRKRMAEEEAIDRIEDAAINSISKNAASLSDELAPQIADDWMIRMRSDYQNKLRLSSGNTPAQTSIHIPAPQPALARYNSEVEPISKNGHKPGLDPLNSRAE